MVTKKGWVEKVIAWQERKVKKERELMEAKSFKTYLAMNAPELLEELYSEEDLLNLQR